MPEVPLLRRIGMTRNWFLLALGWLQRRELLEQTHLVRSDRLLKRVIVPERRCEVEEMFLAPRPGEVPRDFLDGFMAATVAMQSQTRWISFTSDDRTNDRHPRRAGEI